MRTCALGLFLLLGLSLEAQAAYVIEVTASELNVRNGAWGSVLGQVYQGQTFAVRAEGSGWLRIDWRGREAWISGSYARRINAPAVEVTASALNARSGPSLSHSVIGLALRGQAYALLAEAGDWSRIQFDHASAWVSSDYVRRLGAPATSAPVAPAPSPAPPPPASASGVDDQLAALQRGAAQVAREELDLGVYENWGPNRGWRIDLYATTAGMNPGGDWCGYFASFALTTAAQRAGRSFAGRTSLHSVPKVHDWFLYRSYTQAWTPANVAAWEAERSRHQSQGSTRRFITFRGSGGDRYASANGLQHEVYDSPRQLPVRAGDIVLWETHIGLVERYDASSGVLTTIEGNVSNAVLRKRYDLTSSSSRAWIFGFCRPARGDFR